jgi:hypothetical protein
MIHTRQYNGQQEKQWSTPGNTMANRKNNDTHKTIQWQTGKFRIHINTIDSNTYTCQGYSDNSIKVYYNIYIYILPNTQITHDNDHIISNGRIFTSF